ncbi:MAG: 30S ribosome-binding factor RbfA [bacterium]
MTQQRKERVEGLLQQVVCEILQEIKDPRVGFLTVTGIKMTPDLRHAKIYFSVIGDDQARETTLQGLKSAKGFVRTELGKKIRLRFIPEIDFIVDRSLDHGLKIFGLLKQVQSEERIPQGETVE